MRFKSDKPVKPAAVQPVVITTGALACPLGGKKMKKVKALILGIFTLIPILYIIFFISVFFHMFLNTVNSTNTESSINLFKIILPLHLSTMILVIVLLVIYIVNVFKNDTIESNKKALWAIVLFFGNMISMIVYWILHIWKPLCKENRNNKSIDK